MMGLLFILGYSIYVHFSMFIRYKWDIKDPIVHFIALQIENPGPSNSIFYSINPVIQVIQITIVRDPCIRIF